MAKIENVMPHSASSVTQRQRERPLSIVVL